MSVRIASRGADDVPLILSSKDGHAAQFCDACMRKWWGMSVLAIDAAVLAAINAAVERARDKPTPLEVVKAGAVDTESTLLLKDRNPGFVLPKSEHVKIPFGYHAVISFEQQPVVGLCRHLSVSVHEGIDGRCPSVPAMNAIATAFGLAPPWDMVWTEEFEPGRFAVNVIKIERGAAG